MLKLSILVFVSVASTCIAQKSHQQHTTPVPILKQINRHNEDGSYSYGYEAADGSFKIETKSANGEVKGKYGYIDDTGNTREIEYGANQNGFAVSGDGINVPPVTSTNNHGSYPALQTGEIDDGQYREDPLMYNDPRYNSKPGKSSQFRVNNAPARPTYAQPSAIRAPEEPSFRAHQQPAYRPQQQQATYRAQPAQQQSYFDEEPIQQTERPYYQSRFTSPAAAPQQSYFQPQQNYYRPNNNYQQYQHPDQVNIFQGHPATNLDLSTGSYSVTYG